MTDVETVARAIMIAKGGACNVTDWAEREWNPAVAEVWDAATAALAAATPLIEARVTAADERGRKLFAENVMLRNAKQLEAERIGERRATAAIVAWLEKQAAWHDKHDDGLSGFDHIAQAHQESIEAIQDGDHLKGTSNE